MACRRAAILKLAWRSRHDSQIAFGEQPVPSCSFDCTLPSRAVDLHFRLLGGEEGASCGVPDVDESAFVPRLMTAVAGLAGDARELGYECLSLRFRFRCNTLQHCHRDVSKFLRSLHPDFLRFLAAELQSIHDRELQHHLSC